MSTVDPAPATLPSILVVSIPKSGTIYTQRLLTEAIGHRPFSISLGYFPQDLVDYARLPEFVAGGCICSTHLDASRPNLDRLSRFVDRWVVHMRDPRSVVLSWTHHIARLCAERPHLLLHVHPAPPVECMHWPFEQQVWWHLEHFLPDVVAWTRRWFEVIDSGEFRILLTRYDELRLDELAYGNRILDFYDIPASRRAFRPIEKVVETSHFRTGRSDEWLESFTPAQLRHANEAIGEPLLARILDRP
jgi:hypothetical protein